MTARVKVADVGDIPAGELLVVEAAGKPIALANVDGTIHALSNACLHRGGPLGEGDLDGTTVICPWHGWRWDVRTGANANNPAIAVACFPVTVDGGAVYVDV
jgi:nitrite reductase (NADH) small subunit